MNNKEIKIEYDVTEDNLIKIAEKITTFEYDKFINTVTFNIDNYHAHINLLLDLNFFNEIKDFQQDAVILDGLKDLLNEEWTLYENITVYDIIYVLKDEPSDIYVRNYFIEYVNNILKEESFNRFYDRIKGHPERSDKK